MAIEQVDSCVEVYRAERLRIQLFMNSVRDFFLLNPALSQSSPPIVHSVKSRLKDESHLRDSIARKNARTPDDMITSEILLSRVTDLAGVRVLHLYQQQFISIAEQIDGQISSGEWVLFEKPKAYTWD